MTHNNTLNVKLSNSKLNAWQSGMKNDTQVILNLSSSVIDDSDHETNFQYKLGLTDPQVLRFRKTFASNSSANRKLSKTQASKMVQLRESADLFATSYRGFISLFI